LSRLHCAAEPVVATTAGAFGGLSLHPPRQHGIPKGLEAMSNLDIGPATSRLGSRSKREGVMIYYSDNRKLEEVIRGNLKGLGYGE
jgi:hypothetical protein